MNIFGKVPLFTVGNGVNIQYNYAFNNIKHMMAVDMNPGTILSDDNGNDWTIRDQLGSGAWGITFAATNPAGEQFLLKIPHRVNAQTDSPPLPESATETFNAISAESAVIASRGAFGPRPVATLTLPSGGVGVVYQRHTTLQQLINGGMGLVRLVELAIATCEKLQEAPHLHGNLHPSNILVDGDTVLLADPLTDSHKAYFSHVRHWHQSPHSTHPPEYGAPHSGYDTWSICHFLCLGIANSDDREAQKADLDVSGLSRINAQQLNDSLLTTISTQGLNPNFAPKAVKDLLRILTRGLSKNATPSPPYRFQSVPELHKRLQNVLDFLSPAITGLGSVHLSANATNGTFMTDNAPSLSVSVAVSNAVKHHDIQPGVRLVDLDSPAGERIPLDNLTYDVRKRVGDRIRFTFNLPLLNVARYRTTFAFSLRASNDKPITTHMDFDVAPTAGTLPPIIGESTPFPTVVPAFTEPDVLSPGTSIDEIPPSIVHHEPLPTPIAPATSNVDMPDSSPHAEVPFPAAATDGPVTAPPAVISMAPAVVPSLDSEPDTNAPPSFDSGPKFSTLPPISQSGAPATSPGLSMAPMDPLDPVAPHHAPDNLSASFDDFEDFDNTAIRIKDHLTGWIESVKNDRVMALMVVVISLLMVVLISMAIKQLP